jgi:hypothetical protein
MHSTPHRLFQLGAEQGADLLLTVKKNQRTVLRQLLGEVVLIQADAQHMILDNPVRFVFCLQDFQSVSWC